MHGLWASANPREVSRDLTLWYKQPAERWSDALPLGNGRLGAMVFGGVPSERIALNEDTLWSGAPRDWNNASASASLKSVRDLVINKQEYQAADQQCRKMQGPFGQAYEPLGDLLIDFDHQEKAEHYTRSLDLDTAISSVSYMVSGVRFTREAFVSVPDQLFIMRLAADRPGTLSCTLRLASQLRPGVRATEDFILLTGKAPSNSVPNYLHSDGPISFRQEPGLGMYFAAVLQVTTKGGSTMPHPDGSLSIAGATEIVLRLGAATGYKTYDAKPDLSLDAIVATAEKAIDAGRGLTFERLQQRHVDAHQTLFRRVTLDLGGVEAATAPTDVRVSNYSQQADMSLLALYFQYGRYLMITSSRPGTQPANLQGIWNAELRPPWSSNWTSNINVQMNYWPSETCNLSECHLPLIAMVRDLSQNGRKTAATNYGANGWCSHHNIDLWRQSAPVGEGLQFADPTWANFAMSGPWLCQHLWEHYQFTRDLEYLRDVAFPVMQDSAKFCLDWLIDDGRGGLTTCPSVSTENTFVAPNGKSAQVSAGCTLDVALLRELFGHCMAAAALLGEEGELIARIAVARKRLPDYQVGRHGQLQEWAVDFEENQPGQRHMSHLYPVYPGGEITPRSTPRLAAAARVSLERRLANGGAYTGWSRAWAIGLWARLGDGEAALTSLNMLMLHSTGMNLFDQHPFGESMTEAMRKSSTTPTSVPAKVAPVSAIFQIDGNFGATAAIAEMLLQSHDHEITLFPAWPAAWRTGAVHGLRARGALKVDMTWQNNAEISVTVRAYAAGEHTFRAPARFRFADARDSSSEGPEVVRLQCKAGQSYRLKAVLA